MKRYILLSILCGTLSAYAQDYHITSSVYTKAETLDRQ